MRSKKRSWEGSEADTSAKANGKRQWRPVEVDADLLQDFENQGGLMIEEVSGESPEIHYLDSAWAGDNEAEPRATDSVKRKKPKRKAAGRARSSPVGAQTDGAPGETSAEDAAAKLPAWIPFDVHPSLMAGLSRLRFHTPTEVQARCLRPAILQRKDIVGAAETGSGKTLAFGLPILHHTLVAIEAAGGELTGDGGRQRPTSSTAPAELKALVILPTRELAVQVKSHMNAVAPNIVHAEVFVGGMYVQKQLRLLKRRPRIVVGTPGRLSALLGLSKQARESERCEWLRESLRGLRHLVLDEADRLVECGHFKELDEILALVYTSLERPQQLQTFVFSATLTLDVRAASLRNRDGGKVENLMQRLQLRDARAVHAVDLTTGKSATQETASAAPSSEAPLNARLPEALLFRETTCGTEKDREALVTMWLLRRYRWEHLRNEAGIPGSGALDAHASPGGRVILFVNAISSVSRLTSVLTLIMESPNVSRVLSRAGIPQEKKDTAKTRMSVEVLGLHSRMRQKDRLKRVERFHKLQHAVLVSTDIAARGLDVPGVAAVLHFHPPRNVEVFVHRSGRTARAGQEGESVAFMCPADVPQWSRVYRAVGIAKQRIEPIQPTAFEVQAAREAARLAVDLERRLHKAAKDRHDTSWRRRAASEAELVLSDDEGPKGRKTKPEETKSELEDLYCKLLQRLRRLPKRLGGAPLPRRSWRQGRGASCPS